MASASSKWLCGPITKEEAAAAVMAGGGVNGSFNVRTRPGNEGEYTLCVVYKGRPTHHIIATNDDGLLTVNKRLYGEHKNVTNLVKDFSVERPGWPVPLEYPKGTNADNTDDGGETGGTPSWLKGQISKEEIAESLQPFENGKFAIREHTAPDSWALCVVYKGRPTHHLIAFNDDGILTVNKKTYGDAKTLVKLVDVLSKPNTPGWPVQLMLPTQQTTKGGASSLRSSEDNMNTKPKRANTVVGGGKPSWLKGQISKEEVEEFVKPLENGKFAIREHTAPDSWALCVVYKGRPTHHLIAFNDDGVLTVNKKTYNDAKTLVKLVEVLSQPNTPGWPVQLLVPQVQSKTDSKPKQESKQKPPTGGDSAGGVSSGGGFLHAAMSKEEANALISSKGTGEDGNFFIRARGDDFPDEYVMCVIYRGGPTHHLIVKRDDEFFINKKPTGSKSLDELVEFLKAPGRPSWPVPLKEHVPNGDTVVLHKEEALVKTVKTTAPPSSSPPPPPVSASASWLHGEISREEIESFVSPYENGKFAIRERGDGTQSLCVVYRMRPTHHIIKRVDDHYTINNKRYGNAGTLEEVVEYLSQPNQPGWPVQLIMATPITQLPKETSKQPPTSITQQPQEEESEQPPPRPARDRPKPTTEEEELPDIPPTSTPKAKNLREEVESRETNESPPTVDGYIDVKPAKLRHADSNSSIASNSSRISRSSKSDGLANLSNEQLIAHVRALKVENQRLRQLGGRNGSLEDSILRLQTPDLGRLENQRDSIEILCTQMATLRANLFAKELDRIQESAWLETQSAQLTSQWSTIQQLEQQHANTNANANTNTNANANATRGTRSFNEQIDRVRAGIRRLQIFWEGQEESRVKRSEWLRDELHTVHTHALTLQSGLQSKESALQRQQTIRMKSSIDNFNLKMAHVQQLTSPAQKLLYFGAGAADC